MRFLTKLLNRRGIEGWPFIRQHWLSEHKNIAINKKYVWNKSGTFSFVYNTVPEGQTMYTKQKCKDGLRGACFELVNAAGQAEVSRTISICL